jgi:uncharacterized damage-inducible protein DinB
MSLDKSLRHMAWSNQEIFTALAEFPEEIYGLRSASGEWPVGKILNHFLGAAEWFCYLLARRDWTDLPKITNADVLLKMRDYLGELDQLIISESRVADGEIIFRGDSGSEERTTRSMVLSQAISHTAEHKGQLATILKVNGHHLDLDKFDLWNFESKN